MKRSPIKRSQGFKRSSGLKKVSAKAKPSVAKLKKKADTYFSQYIRLRDSNHMGSSVGLVQCISCPTVKHWKELQNGHFVSRRVNSLRYDEQNCNAQCYSCNVMRHGEQFEYATRLDLKYGPGTADTLHHRRFETHKLTVDELVSIIEKAKLYINAHDY